MDLLRLALRSIVGLRVIEGALDLQWNCLGDDSLDSFTEALRLLAECCILGASSSEEEADDGSVSDTLLIRLVFDRFCSSSKELELELRRIYPALFEDLLVGT